MSVLIDALNHLSAAWLALAWAIAWQSTLLALVIAGMCRALRRSPPAVRYWLWQIVAIKLLVMPFWTYELPPPVSQPPSPAMTMQVGARALAFPSADSAGRRFEPSNALPFESLPSTAPAAEFKRQPAPARAAGRPVRAGWHRMTWRTGLMCAWFGLVFCQVGVIFWQRRWLARQLGQRTAMGDPALETCVAAVAREIGLARPPQVFVLNEQLSPFVCGVWQTRLVLPQVLLAELTAVQLRQVVLHELAHLVRRDLVWGWIAEIARILWVFHPVAHWVNRQIRLERELACDQIALACSGQNAYDYAQTLIQVVSRLATPSAGGDTVAPGMALDGQAVAFNRQTNSPGRQTET